MEANIAKLLNASATDRENLNNLLLEYLDTTADDSESPLDNEETDDDESCSETDSEFDMRQSDFDSAMEQVDRSADFVSGDDNGELAKSVKFR